MNPSPIHYFSNNIEVNIVSGKKICEEKGKLLNPIPTRQVYFFFTVVLYHVTMPIQWEQGVNKGEKNTIEYKKSSGKNNVSFQAFTFLIFEYRIFYF